MSNKSESDRVTWQVTTLEDKATGDLILPIPPELLQKMGWREGDTLNWERNPEGHWILTKS